MDPFIRRSDLAQVAQRYMTITGRQELYYIAPTANLSSILTHGILSHQHAARFLHADISMQEVQSIRSDKWVVDGVTRLHQYANLYLDARNPMMYKRRDSRYDLCVIGVDCSVLDREGTYVADRNAASDYVRFYDPQRAIDALDFAKIFARNWNSLNMLEYYDGKSKKCAEVLVFDRVPVDLLRGIYVADERAQERLMHLGCGLPIFIYPDVFFV